MKEPNQDFIESDNEYFKLILKYHKIILLIILMVILFIPLISNQFIIQGSESYYHLSESTTLKEFFNNPLPLLTSFIPVKFLFLIPITLAFLSLLLVFSITKTIKISERIVFFFLLFLILSPAFIFVYTTISAYSLFIFLILLGMFLLTKNQLKYLSIIPITLALCFDLISSFLLLTALTIIYVKQKKKFPLIPVLIALIILITKKIILNTPYIYGPFHTQQFLPDLISDLGGLSGISFFIIILAFIGLAITWKRKNFSNTYIFFPITIIAFFLNTQAIFFLTLSVVFFATIGLVQLFDKKWTLISLKQFTLLLLILGILFSTLTYTDRIINYEPSEQAQQTLTWIKDNTETDTIVFSLPEESYYVNYFAQRESFSLLHSKNKLKSNLTTTILTSTYINQLFPILEENNIDIIYITPKMKTQFPNLIFLLKNERFKLLHSNEETEVWLFN